MRKHPQLLELNAFFFISRMSEKYGRKLTLSMVPDDEWRGFAEQGFDYIWLMGVWKRSPFSRDHARKQPNLCRAYDMILPGWQKEDVTGSPYAIHDYEVDAYLGVTTELLSLKLKLNGMGLGLILDFVPNHLASDHPWTIRYPHRFVSCRKETLKAHPDWAFTTGKGVKLAHGRDPYFPPWIDTVQNNFWCIETRQALLESLLTIAKLADGVRCDMAMLALNDVFQKVWGEHIMTPPLPTEFWADVIPKVKHFAPHFRFLGEVYWGMEWELQQLGFDYTYDKRLYDRLCFDSPISVRDHLKAETVFQDRSLRFIENHDEERACVVFGKKKSQAAGIIAATVQGLRFFHDGQLEGRRVRTPIHLRREPKEPAEPETAEVYRKLLQFTHSTILHEGHWTLLDCERAWDRNETCLGVVAWMWSYGKNRKIIIVNYSMIRSQAYVRIPGLFPDIAFLQLRETLTGAVYDCPGREIFEKGFYVDLMPWQAYLLDLVF
ncbi:MAG: alpha-amylase [Candidatus Omnitrophica bacterium]|nr:alpha-amylase [Candidatus Omnitrophota bacterium]